MYAALCHGPDIVQIHASKRNFDLGKWNISTTHDSWEAVKAWLDKHLLALYNSIPANVRHTYPSYHDFTEPQRVHLRVTKLPHTLPAYITRSSVPLMCPLPPHSNPSPGKPSAQEA
jgi:hypothetical protein